VDTTSSVDKNGRAIGDKCGARRLRKNAAEFGAVKCGAVAFKCGVRRAPDSPRFVLYVIFE
jgi:hypothetical protein